MNSIVWSEQVRFLLAFALSGLVGLEREHSRASGNPHAVGVRTHILTCLFGFGLADLHGRGMPLVLPLGLLSVGLIQAASFWRRTASGHFGWTSEMSILVSFLVGVLCMVSEVWIPTAITILGVLVLTEKAEIEHLVERLDRSEFLAVIKFLVVTCIVLPMLPDRNFTAWDINPSSTWKIVVMVSSVGFVGYFLTRKLGGRMGLWVSGIVGGVVSSTAVAVATGRIAAKSPEKAGAALQSAILASSVMYLRILVLVWIVSPTFGRELSWRLPVLSVVGLLLALSVPNRARQEEKEQMENLQNPFEILPALIFAGFFTLFSVATAVVRTFMGGSGLVLLALVVGVVDIDPFILSVAREARIEKILITAILMAMMSNTIAKGVYFGSLAAPIRKQAFLRYGLWALCHIPLALI
jgi:uncharacterized membrane protein (DUF4010 family)